MAQSSEQEFQAWEKLVNEGVGGYDAARQVGTTLTRLKNGDRVRYEKGMLLCQERRAAKVEQVMDAQAQRPEPSPAVLNTWAKANHPAYADRTQVEISGTIQHEAKVVTLGDILEVVRTSQGLDNELDDRPRGALPGTANVLPAPAEPEAGRVPARRES